MTKHIAPATMVADRPGAANIRNERIQSPTDLHGVPTTLGIPPEMIDASIEPEGDLS